jgi:hypothetical protein
MVASRTEAFAWLVSSLTAVFASSMANFATSLAASLACSVISVAAVTACSDTSVAVLTACCESRSGSSRSWIASIVELISSRVCSISAAITSGSASDPEPDAPPLPASARTCEVLT